MERLKPPVVENTDLPPPWEMDVVISEAAWIKHRDMLMANAAPGTRPSGWWLYEHQKDPPPGVDATIYLWRIGELKGAERAQVETWWRAHYESACSMANRTSYWRWRDLPAELVERWDDTA